MAENRKGRGQGLYYWTRGQLLILAVGFTATSVVVFFLGILIGQGIEERKLVKKEEPLIKIPVQPLARGSAASGARGKEEMTFYEELAKKLNILFQQFGTVEETIKISGNTEEEIMQALNSEHNDAVQQILAAGGRTPEEIRAGVEMKFEDLGITSLQKRSGKTYMSFVGKELGDPNEFEVEVRAGTDIPKTKLDIVAMTEKMMGNPATALDIETFLDIIEFPQKDKVLERNKLWQMFRQWLVQQQEAEKQGQQSQQVPEGSQGPGQAQPQGQPGQGPAGGPGMGQVA